MHEHCREREVQRRDRVRGQAHMGHHHFIGTLTALGSPPSGHHCPEPSAVYSLKQNEGALTS